MAFLKALLIALACEAVFAAGDDSKAMESDGERTIFIDGGMTDSIGLVDLLLFIGTFTLAVLTALLILGLIYGFQEDTNSYETTGYADDTDSYSAYERVYSVARSLYNGYQKYEAARDLKE